jgi:hypothetical protein|tara:strand:- start:3977 stop:4750 length:774 start_codon:yes stop_codon:yes gene_type:complete
MQKTKLLIIGKKSLIANNYYKLSKIKHIDIISYFSIDKINLKKYSHILNFSFDPKNFKKNYNLTNKLDKKICKLIKNQKTIYILPSSRFVNSSTKNKNLYGINKRKIEKDIIKIKKKNLLILRIGNILTFDTSNRSLFISKALRNLKKYKFIKLDLDKNTYKDFITLDIFSNILDQLINKKITGIFNLSSNFPTKVHDVVESIIKGYGKGIIIYEKKLKKNDSFLLNNKKLKKVIKFKISKEHILNYCRLLGRKLNA